MGQLNHNHVINEEIIKMARESTQILLLWGLHVFMNKGNNWDATLQLNLNNMCPTDKNGLHVENFTLCTLYVFIKTTSLL